MSWRAFSSSISEWKGEHHVNCKLRKYYEKYIKYQIVTLKNTLTSLNNLFFRLSISCNTLTLFNHIFRLTKPFLNPWRFFIYNMITLPKHCMLYLHNWFLSLSISKVRRLFSLSSFICCCRWSSIICLVSSREYANPFLNSCVLRAWSIGHGEITIYIGIGNAKGEVVLDEHGVVQVYSTTPDCGQQSTQVIRMWFRC